MGVMRQAEILVNDTSELEKIRQKGMDDMSIKYLVEKGVMGIRRVDKGDMKRLARVTGAKIQLTLSNIDGDEEFEAESLGHSEIVEEERVGDNEFIFVKGAKDAKASTLLLRGANEFMLEETERSVHDALMAVSKTAESSSVVPGAGACETALSLHLEDYARTLESKEQLAVDAFAQALLVIPTTLTINAALDAIDLTSQLRVVHQEARNATGAFSKMNINKGDHQFYGLDLIGNGVQNSVTAGVVEPMISKLKSLKFATEAAITIIRIDDLIKLDPEEPPQ